MPAPARRLLPALLAVGLALAASAQSPAASTAWSRPQAVASTTCPKAWPSHLRAAQNAAGDRLLAWVEQCGHHRSRVVAVSGRARHRFGRPVILSRLGAAWWDLSLRTALDADGRATVVWQRRRESGPGPVVAATRPPGGRFGAPQVLDERGGEIALAANRRGEAVVAWMRERGAEAWVVAALRAPGARRFAPAQVLAGPLVSVPNGPEGGHNGIHANPAVGIADDGTAIVAWRQADGSAADCCGAIEASVRPSGEPFSAAVPVSPPKPFDPYQAPAVGIADRQRAYVAWVTLEFSQYPRPQTAGVTRWDGSAFAPPLELVRTVGGGGPTALIDDGVLVRGSGNALVQWRGWDSPCSLDGRPVMGVDVPSTGDPGPARQLLPMDRLYADFRTVLDARDRLVTVWISGVAWYPDRSPCSIRTVALGASIDGGAPIDGPAVDDAQSQLVLAGAPGPTPLLAWFARGRLVLTRLYA